MVFVSHCAYGKVMRTVTAEEREDARIVLGRGETIGGQVRFPDGSPAPHVFVALHDRGSWTRTDAEGRFAFRGRARDDHQHLVLALHSRQDHPMQSGGGSWTSFEGRAGQTDLDVAFHQWVVAARVVDDRGRPFRYATVTDGRFRYRTGADGIAYFVRGYERCRLHAVSPGCLSEPVNVPRSEAPGLETVTLVMRRDIVRGDVELLVRNTSGEIPPAIYVTARLAETNTVLPLWENRRLPVDEHGRARLEGLPARHCKLALQTRPWASRKRYELAVEASVSVRAGETTTREVVFPMGGRIRVWVRNGQDVSVPPRSIELDGQHALFMRTTADEGSTISTPYNARSAYVTPWPLQPGRYRVSIRGEQAGAIEVRVEPGRTVTAEFIRED